MKCKFVLPVLLIAISGVASAGELDSMQVASELSSMLASEEACGLVFDQAAIEAFVEKKVRADDMAFPSYLNMMTSGKKSEVAEMGTSQKAAHCTQIKRVAKSYGFVK